MSGNSLTGFPRARRQGGGGVGQHFMEGDADNSKIGEWRTRCARSNVHSWKPRPPPWRRSRSRFGFCRASCPGRHRGASSPYWDDGLEKAQRLRGPLRLNEEGEASSPDAISTFQHFGVVVFDQIVRDDRRIVSSSVLFACIVPRRSTQMSECT